MQTKIFWEALAFIIVKGIADRCRDCPVSRCVELLIVVLTLDSYLSLCRLVLAY